MPIEVFGKCILKDLLKVKPDEVLCLQTGIDKSYEVSFLMSAGCNHYLQKCAWQGRGCLQGLMS